MALPTRYGSAFLAGTKGATFAAGYDIANAASGAVVDGGTIIKAGNKASDSPITNDLSVNTLADNLGERRIGSKVVANAGTGAATTDRVGVSGAIAANVADGAVLGFNASATQWVMQGGNVTTTLAGSANTRLASPAREIVNSVGASNDVATKVARTKISDVTQGSGVSEEFNIFARPSTQIVPGRTIGGGAGETLTFTNPADGSAAVKAEIAPSKALPGELTYHFGALGDPTTDEYKSKEDRES